MSGVSDNQGGSVFSDFLSNLLIAGFVNMVADDEKNWVDPSFSLIIYIKSITKKTAQ